MLISTRTGRVLSPGDSLRMLTPRGFTEGVLDTVTPDAKVRVRAGQGTHDVPFDDVEAIWALS